MEISGVASKQMSTGSPSQKNDLSGEVQKLEQLKRNMKQQLKQLEQSKQGGDTIENEKSKLQRKINEIDQQIQTLKSQGEAETQTTEDKEKSNPPRFDEYVKNDKEASGTGVYSVEKDENGNPLIILDSPEKPSQESPKPAFLSTYPQQE